MESSTRNCRFPATTVWRPNRCPHHACVTRTRAGGSITIIISTINTALDLCETVAQRYNIAQHSIIAWQWYDILAAARRGTKDAMSKIIWALPRIICQNIFTWVTFVVFIRGCEWENTIKSGARNIIHGFWNSCTFMTFIHETPMIQVLWRFAAISGCIIL